MTSIWSIIYGAAWPFRSLLTPRNDQIADLNLMGLQSDRLFTAMRNDADVGEKMLAVTTSKEI